MDRRRFLQILGGLSLAAAAEEMIPLGRVFSFPSKIVIAPASVLDRGNLGGPYANPLNYDDLNLLTVKYIIPRLVDNVYRSSPVFFRLIESETPPVMIGEEV